MSLTLLDWTYIIAEARVLKAVTKAEAVKADKSAIPSLCSVTGSWLCALIRLCFGHCWCYSETDYPCMVHDTGHRDTSTRYYVEKWMRRKLAEGGVTGGEPNVPMVS